MPLDPGLLAPLTRDPSGARAEELAPGLWVLMTPLPLRRVETVNCVLARQADGWLLIDCGMEWEPLEYGLGLAGLKPGDVNRLLVTHLHCDHAELAWEFVRRTGCELVRGSGPEAITDRLRDPRIELAERKRFAARDGIPEHELSLYVDARVADHGKGPVPRADRILADGDIVQTEVGEWRVVSTRGHSNNQIALFEPELGYLIAADAAYPTIPFVEWGFSPDPMADYLASLERIRGLAPEYFIPGHGRPGRHRAQRLTGAEKAVTGLVEHALSVLSRGESTAYEIAGLLTSHDPDPDHRQSMFGTVIALLEHLAGQGRISAACENDRRRWILI